MASCPACGKELPGEFPFCPFCGALLSAPAAREQRKTVTVLFCDVTGSTALGERLDPESLRHVMARYFETASEVVERHGGTVEKFIGDAVMAVFGVPLLHEDDALRALRAAADLRDGLVALNEELSRDFGTELQVRIGVNTGEVVTGTEERLATGDAVNVAARLEQAAAPGEILLGAETLRLTRDAVEIEAVEPLALKGKAERLVAYRLARVEPGVAGLARHLDAPMVGRERELARLRDAFSQAVADRSCQLFTSLGAAGVGKSRLAAEFLSSLAGAEVVQGRCLPYGEGITYWPVVEVLKQLLGGNIDRVEEFGLDRRAVAAIRSVLGDESAFGSAEEIAWAVRKLLETVAAARPLAVVFDDLHWGEETFLDLIEHISDLSRDAPILVFCMARPELLDRRPGWGGGKLNATTVLLEPLSADETNRLIEELLADEPLDDSLRARILEAAEGNPLYVEEMVAMLRDSPGGEVVVPPTIQALLAARLDQLDPAEREVLERGSVEGRVFHRGAVEALAPDDGSAGGRLTSLVRKELVRPDRTQIPGDDAFRFRHLLIRDAAYDSLPKASRAELHERFAIWLEKHGANLVELDEILGYHLEQAYRYRSELGPLDEQARDNGRRAADRLALAGRRALTRFDVGAAISLLDRAWAVRSDTPVDIDLGLTLADALFDGGRLTEAVACALAVAEQASASGDAPGELWARINHARLGSNVDPSITAGRILELVKAGRSVFEESGEVRALAATAEAEIWAESSLLQSTRVADAATRLVEAARGAGDRHRELQGLMWLAVSGLNGPVPSNDVLRLLESDPSLDDFVRRRQAIRALLLASLGRVDEGRALLITARERFHELGAVVGEALVACASGGLEMLAGDYAAAEGFLREGCDTFERIGEKGFLSTYVALHGQALLELDKLEEAAAAASRSRELGAVDDIVTQMLWRQLQAKILARRGEHEESVRLAEEAVALGEPTDASDFKADALRDLADVYEYARKPDDARAALRRALDLYERKGNLVMAARVRKQLTDLTPS